MIRFPHRSEFEFKVDSLSVIIRLNFISFDYLILSDFGYISAFLNFTFRTYVSKIYGSARCSINTPVCVQYTSNHREYTDTLI